MGLVKRVCGSGWDWSKVSAGVSGTGQESLCDWPRESMRVGGRGEEGLWEWEGKFKNLWDLVGWDYKNNPVNTSTSGKNERSKLKGHLD